MAPGVQSWAAVVPVKRLSLAKTRLAVADDVRADLALAMAADTVAACLAARLVTTVVVVTDDDRAATAMAALGATVVPDMPDAGLNPALRHGADVAATQDPGAGVFAVSSDLPALSGAALDDVLGRAGSFDTACVADAAGTGTTLLAARTAAAFVPAFGPESWQRHRDGGAADLTAAADPRLRRDVDTLADLADAVALGCGAATAAVLASAGEAGPPIRL